MRTCRSDLYNSSPQAGKITSCLFSHEFGCNLQDFVGNLPQFVGRFGPLGEFAVVHCCSLKILLRCGFYMVWFKHRTSCEDREWPCSIQITGNKVLLHTHRGLKSAGKSGAPFMSHRSRKTNKSESSPLENYSSGQGKSLKRNKSQNKTKQKSQQKLNI